MIAASFFVPELWAVVTLRVVGGFTLFFGHWANGLNADASFPDHNHDEIVYQKPGSTYTLHPAR